MAAAVASEGVGFVEGHGHGSRSPWDGLVELTKSAQERNMDPLMWAMQTSSSLTSAGLSMPSPELANLLVHHICWANNIPIAWKFLEKALTLGIVPPMLVLALLSTRSSFSSINHLFPVSFLLFLGIWVIFWINNIFQFSFFF